MPPSIEAPSRCCGPDCQYAEEIRGHFGEWYWCSRPEAPRRLVRSLQECVVPRFQRDLRSPPPIELARSLPAAK